VHNLCVGLWKNSVIGADTKAQQVKCEPEAVDRKVLRGKLSPQAMLGPEQPPTATPLTETSLR
jgi:hypothetical protein